MVTQTRQNPLVEHQRCELDEKADDRQPKCSVSSSIWMVPITSLRVSTADHGAASDACTKVGCLIANPCAPVSGILPKSARYRPLGRAEPDTSVKACTLRVARPLLWCMGLIPSF
jgi:hypothetical protein